LLPSFFVFIQDPWFYAVALPSVLIIGLGKGGFGPGTSLLAMPLMSLVMPPLQAAAIMLPVLCAMDLAGLWGYRNSFDKRVLAIIIPGSLIGIVIGTLAAGYVTNSAIEIIVGGISVIFVFYRWFGQKLLRRAAEAEAEPQPKVAKGVFWSTLAGFTSFIAHAGAPPLTIYLLPLNMTKDIFLGTTVVFFAVTNYVKLVPYAWLGQFSASNIGTALLLAPLAVAGVYAGIWLQRRIDDKLFFRIIYGLTLLCGLKLLSDGFGLT